MYIHRCVPCQVNCQLILVRLLEKKFVGFDISRLNVKSFL